MSMKEMTDYCNYRNTNQGPQDPQPQPPFHTRAMVYIGAVPIIEAHVSIMIWKITH